MNFWNREPARIVALLQAAIVLGMSFGLALTAHQQGAILAFVALALGEITRSQLSPAAKPSSGDGTPVHVHLREPDETPTDPTQLRIVGLACLALVGCGLLGGGASPEEPPCDEASYAKLSVECGDDETACDKALEERETFCAKRIEGEP